MSQHEIVTALLWLQATLSGDSALVSYAPGGVHADDVPDGTVTPYITYGSQSGGVDSLTMNAVRLLTNPLYQVVATGPTSQMAAIASAASELDDLLKRTAGSVVGGLVSACYREQPVEKNERINAVKWKSIGGLYRLTIQQS